KPPDERFASHIIADATGIARPTMLKMLEPLVKACVLDSMKGPNGGYRLARPAEAISLLEIIEAMDGPITNHARMQTTPALAACVSVAVRTCQHLARVSVAALMD